MLLALLVIRLRLLTNILVLLLPSVGCALLLPAVGYALVLLAVGYALLLRAILLLLFVQHFSSVHSDSVLEYRHPSSIAILWLRAVFGNLALPLSLTSFHHWLCLSSIAAASGALLQLYLVVVYDSVVRFWHLQHHCVVCATA